MTPENMPAGSVSDWQRPRNPCSRCGLALFATHATSSIALSGRPLTVARSLKIVDLAFGFVAGHSVTLLDLADQLFAFAFDHVQVVVGQLAPFLLRLAFD